MARPIKPVKRRVQRRVLTYDQADKGISFLTRVDITIEGNDGSSIPTPITPLYAARLVPFFRVPKRPADITLRQLTVCLTDGGTRTVYVPYTSINSDHNNMLREYLTLIPNENYESIRYKGEEFIK